VIDQIVPSTTSVNAVAYEKDPTAATWSLITYAVCADVS